MNYMCESAGALAYKFLCQLMVRKREQISEETVTKLKAIQENRCGTCGDLLRRYEKHRKKPFCKGGTDDLDNLVLLCPQCHAQETEKQEQANCGTSSVFWNQDLAQECIIYLQIYLFQDNFTGATWSNRPEQENKGAQM